MLNIYDSEVYQNEENLFKSVTSYYPSEMVDYLALFYSLNFESICQFIEWNKDLSAIKEGFVFVVPPNSTRRELQTAQSLLEEC